jgi:hypothetical protein
MGDVVKSSDLTKLEGDPGARAEVAPVLEQCDVAITLPTLLGGGKVNISTRTRAAVVMIDSIATLLLVLSGSLVAGIALAAGGPTWLALAAGAITPPAYFALAHTFFRQTT